MSINSNAMKKWLLFCFFLVVIIFMPPVSQATTSFDKVKQDVMTKLGVNETVAIKFLSDVDDFVSDVQDNFTKIASHKTPKRQKKSLIKKTLDKFFDDLMNSEVQVANLKGKVSSYPIKVYLKRLYKLAFKYKTVKLLFDKSYFDMGPIESYAGGRYSFKLDMWQRFEGCYGKRCYRDFTKRGFQIVFVPSSSGWSMKISAMTANKPVRAYAGDSENDWKKRKRPVAVPQQMCRLTVKAIPPDSRIRIMDITIKYYPGIPITCGSHEILVDKPGYIPYIELLHVGPIAAHYLHEVVLEKPSQSVYEDIKVSQLKYISETLAALDAAFKKHEPNYLDKISTSRFQRTKWYKTLKSYVGSFSINLNHCSEIATQEFIINRNEKHVLIIDFDKSKKTNKWHITDAHIRKGNKMQPLLEHGGFRPLEYERNFSELLRQIKSGKIWTQCGLGPYGKLNHNFLKGKTLSSSRKKTIKKKNVIIHNYKGIQDIIYLTLTYDPTRYKEGDYKSGWLLDGGESMRTLYKKGENLYIDILFKRDFNLNAPNKGLASSKMK